MKKTVTTALGAGVLFLIFSAFARADESTSSDGLQAFDNITLENAKAFIAKADTTGDARLLDYSGWILCRGLGVPADLLKAGKFFDRAADKGNSRGRTHLIALSANPDFIQQVKAAAGAQDVEAENLLGELYSHGWGVGQDYAQAMSCYQQADKAGFAAAPRNIALAYELGRGIPKDQAQATLWFQKAAKKGDGAAEEALGKIEQEGWGTKVSFARAMALYQKALTWGDADAGNDLGWIYQQGLGVKKDMAQAKDYYENAANRGNADAANNLGYLYHTGEGTARDDQQALNWYLQAANNGNADSRKGMHHMDLDGGLRRIVQEKLTIHFQYDQSSLNASDTLALRILGEILAWSKNGRARIDCYGDNRGSEEHNQKLSERRAACVREFLLYHGAKLAVFQVAGHGSQSPIAPNDSETNMAKNRRAEIKVWGI